MRRPWRVWSASRYGASTLGTGRTSMYSRWVARACFTTVLFMAGSSVGFPDLASVLPWLAHQPSKYGAWLCYARCGHELWVCRAWSPGRRTNGQFTYGQKCLLIVKMTDDFRETGVFCTAAVHVLQGMGVPGGMCTGALLPGVGRRRLNRWMRACALRKLCPCLNMPCRRRAWRGRSASRRGRHGA